MVKKSKVTRKSKRAPEVTSSVELVQWAAEKIEKGKRGRMSPVQVAAELMADLDNLASANAMSRDQVAFESLAATLEALPDGLAATARFDLRDAPKPVLDFAVQAAPYAEAFRALDAIKPGSGVALELMVLAVSAGRYIRQQVDLEEAVEDRAVVDKTVVDQASRHLTGMLGVLAHNFQDDERMIARIDALKAGRSHEKLRFGLGEAAKLYRSHRAFLANDKNRFKIADARTATQLANDIGLQLDLGRSRSSQAWRDLAQRAASVLLAAHAHVRAMMVLLHVGQVDDPNETYPSLRSLLAAASAGRGAEAQAPDEAPKPNGVAPAAPGDA
jgi:hypothetical protein